MLKDPTTPPTPVKTDETAPVGRDANYGDRILLWCFVASIVVNLGFAFWLNYADIYGTKRVAQEQKQMKLKIYKPPIKQKPKPKKKLKVIPPKPIKIVHKLPPPRPIPHPTPHPPPPAPRAPSVGHTSNSHNAVNVGPTTTAPPVAAPQTPGIDTRPQAPIVAPPAPPPPVIKPVPPAPVVVAPPLPKPRPPAPPPPPPKPKGYVDVESRKASIDESSIPQVDTQGLGIDPNTITGPCVISFTVSTTGRISGVRVKKSSGSSDFDDACVKVFRQGRGIPGVQDHILYEAQGQYSFNAG